MRADVELCISIATGAHMNTHDIILKQFGILLTISDVATLFKTSVAALRMQMTRQNNLGAALNKIKIQRDRRLFFPATGVAAIIDGEER